MAGKIPSSPLDGLGISGNNFGEMLQDVISDSAVGNILSVAPNSKYITGGRCIIKINGRLAGFAFAISWNIKTEQDEIYTIDDWMPYEMAPKRVSVDGTIGMFHIPGKDPGNMLIQSNVLSFMFHRYITLEVRDNKTNKLLFFTNSAVITSRQESVNAEEINKISLSWKAVGFRDAKTPAYPRGIATDKEGKVRKSTSFGPITLVSPF